MNIEILKQKIISSAIEVHKELGPGLLESTYERCLIHELSSMDYPLNTLNTRMNAKMKRKTI